MSTDAKYPKFVTTSSASYRRYTLNHAERKHLIKGGKRNSVRADDTEPKSSIHLETTDGYIEGSICMIREIW